jgi:hypothetical protein
VRAKNFDRYRLLSRKPVTLFSYKLGAFVVAMNTHRGDRDKH